jgi:hypothetical protein
LAGKRLELLKETVPKLSRVAVLWDPQQSSSTEGWKESQIPARELGLQLHSMPVSSVEQTKARSGALVWMASPLGIGESKIDCRTGREISPAGEMLGEPLSRMAA